MKRFGDEFKQKLKQTVSEIENNTGAELVVALVPAAHSYLRINLFSSLLFGNMIFTLLMFIPKEIWYVGIYIETLIAFIVGFFIPNFIPPVKRMLSGKSNMKKNAELLAGSMFHKGKIYETRHRTGVFILFSFFEREVVIIADKTVSDLVPALKLSQLENDLEKCFTAINSEEAILEGLKKSGEIFSVHVPRTPEDINELPDDLWIS